MISVVQTSGEVCTGLWREWQGKGEVDSFVYCERFLLRLEAEVVVRVLVMIECD